MHPVHLDFLNRRARPGRTAWLCCAVGFLLFLAAGVWAWSARGAADEFSRVGTARLQAAEAAIAAKKPKGLRVDGLQVPEEWNRAMKVAKALNSPWQSLFASLEGEVERPVALLNIEADSGRQELTLFAEAKNFDEMLSFLNFLKEQSYLSNVMLHAHQINQQDRENPVRFRVTAHWTE